MTERSVPSPCTGVCRIDESSGWCAGCARTIDEIAAWGSLDDSARLAVWGRLRERRRARACEHAATTPSPTDPSP